MSVFGAAAAGVTEFIPASGFAAAAAEDTAFAASLSLGAEASAAAILAVPALVLGAGTLGWYTGEAIRKWLDKSPTAGPLRRPFTGGQQPGRVYHITYTVVTPEFGTQTVSVNRPGPIGPPIVTTYTQAGTTRHDASFTYQGGVEGVIQGASDPTTLSIDSVIPVDGNPDSTKNLPLDMPAALAPANGLLYPGSHTLPDGTVLPIPSQVVPNELNSPDVKEDERVAPGVVVRQPTLGQELQFTPTGVYIRRYNPGPENPEEAPKVALPPGIPTTRTDEKCPCPPGKDDEIIKRLKDLANCERCQTYDYAITTVPETASGKVGPTTDPVYTALVQVTKQPLNARVQRSTFPAPDVIYCGWYCWLIGSVESDRKPLHFGSQSFIAPDGANGFVFQLNYGFKGTARVTTRHLVPPPEPPL